MSARINRNCCDWNESKEPEDSRRKKVIEKRSGGSRWAMRLTHAISLVGLPSMWERIWSNVVLNYLRHWTVLDWPNHLNRDEVRQWNDVEGRTVPRVEAEAAVIRRNVWIVASEHVMEFWWSDFWEPPVWVEKWFDVRCYSKHSFAEDLHWTLEWKKTKAFLWHFLLCLDSFFVWNEQLLWLSFWFKNNDFK